jgi:sugar lactone lactonase YvrE
MAIDAAGDVFIADRVRIRKVTPQGIISTYAGGLNGGDSGDGGPATQAMLGAPMGLVVDSSGNLYVTTACRVRKITPEGIISAFSGVPNGSCTSVDGPQGVNSLDFPSGLARDQNGVIYISEPLSSGRPGRIRRLGTDGVMTTLAGGSSLGSSGDGGPATAATLTAPTGVALDSAGNLYFSDTYRIREITADGIIHTVTGRGTSDFSGDQGPASLAGISAPSGVATDAFGNVYIADSTNFRIRKIDSSGIITTSRATEILGSRARAGKRGMRC